METTERYSVYQNSHFVVSYITFAKSTTSIRLCSRLASQAPLINRCWGLADLSPVVGVGVDALEVDAVELCVGLVEEGAVVEEVVDVYSCEG